MYNVSMLSAITPSFVFTGETNYILLSPMQTSAGRQSLGVVKNESLIFIGLTHLMLSSGYRVMTGTF